MTHWLWLVPASPLIGAIMLGLCGEFLPARVSGVIGTASVGIAAMVAADIFMNWVGHPPPGAVFVQTLWNLITLPDFSIKISLYLDPVSLLMILVITVIGCLIHLFSTAYMQGEAGYSRYFAYLNLFVAAMLLLVLADDLLVLFIGWEGVGVCSYLLVGFWFSDPANGYAARKSFVVTRIADTFMLAGLLLLSVTLGTLSIPAMHAHAAILWPHAGVYPNIAAALLLAGGLGKSAQIPFQTWLPDAMAGPTPVSALIHAATMVTAGMYLVIRLHPLFLLAPDVLAAIAIIAAATLLLASVAALVQSDIKRVLAYSTIAQIGYMFLALGVGAWSAAMFHFLTHAVFKALLFLSAGAIAMRLHHEQDIFRMGGLRTRLPLAFAAFLTGSAALAALPVITAGWFSKELILGQVWFGGALGPWLWAAALLGAVLTATYIFRTVFMVFFGAAHTEISGAYGVRVALPLAVLSLGALSIGWLETPSWLGGNNALGRFLSPLATANPVHAMTPALQACGVAAPLLGLVFAYAGYRGGFWQNAARRQGRFIMFIEHGFGFDEVFAAILIQPYLWLVRVLRDDPVDLVFTAIAAGAKTLHQNLRLSQGGKMRRYAGWMMAGGVAAIAIVVFT